MSPADLYGGSGLDLGFEAGFGEDPALLSAQARAKALRRARVGRGSQTDTAGTSTSLSAAPSAPVAFAAPTQPSQPGQRPVGQRDFTGERSQIEGELTKANAPEDYSALSQYARDRDRQGHRSLILALAAQQAGDEFALLATHFARAAEANRTPLKVTGGMLDSGGKFLADPAYQQEQRRATLEKRLDSLNASEQSAGQFTMQQARLAEEATARHSESQERREEAQARHDENIAIRREAQLNASQARGDAAAVRADTTRFRGEDTMRAQWNALTADFRAEQDAINKVRSLPVGRPMNPIELQSLMVLINKIQDPTSVVREGEFNRIASAQSLLSQYTSQMWEKVFNGAPISQKLAGDIRQVAELYSTASRNTVQRQADDQIRIAHERGYDPTAVVPDLQWHRKRGNAAPPVTVTPIAPPATVVKPGSTGQGQRKPVRVLGVETVK